MATVDQSGDLPKDKCFRNHWKTADQDSNSHSYGFSCAIARGGRAMFLGIRFIPPSPFAVQRPAAVYSPSRTGSGTECGGENPRSVPAAQKNPVQKQETGPPHASP